MISIQPNYILLEKNGLARSFTATFTHITAPTGLKSAVYVSP